MASTLSPKRSRIRIIRSQRSSLFCSVASIVCNSSRVCTDGLVVGAVVETPRIQGSGTTCDAPWPPASHRRDVRSSEARQTQRNSRLVCYEVVLLSVILYSCHLALVQYIWLAMASPLQTLVRLTTHQTRNNSNQPTTHDPDTPLNEQLLSHLPANITGRRLPILTRHDTLPL
jgi:hypothetical protein